ncbi:MAG: hypothetical protein AB8B81_06945 [Halioglobus sp.]
MSNHMTNIKFVALLVLFSMPVSSLGQNDQLSSAELRKLADQRIADQKTLEASNRRIQELRAQRQAQMAQDSMHPETRKAWDRYKANTYGDSAAAETMRKRDFLRLQRDWDHVQAEAHKGNISAEDNSRFLVDHSIDMKKRMTKAGNKHGLGVSLQDPSGAQKTYSDVDGHGRPVWRNGNGKTAGKVGEMSVEQFTGARQDFNAQFNRDLDAVGLGTMENPAAGMRSDLMPITDDPELFRAVEGKINPDGGVMYQNTDAVRQEVLNRQRNPDGSWKGDTTDAKTKAAYLQEQIRQQRAHAIESQHMLEEGNRLVSDPASSPDDLERGRRMLEQAQGEGSSLIGKYEERANRVINQAAGQAGTEGIEISPTRQAAIDAVGGTRDLSVTQESADIVATTENAIRNQQVEGARTLMLDGEIEAAAEVARNADASTRGRIVDETRAAAFEQHRSQLIESGVVTDPAEIDRLAGVQADKDARRLVSEMRRNATPDVFDSANNRWTTNSAMDASGLRARVGQAAELGGQVMEGVDALNAGADVVDYHAGRISGSELMSRLGSRVPIVGDAYGAGQEFGQSFADRVYAQPSTNEAHAAIQNSWTHDAQRQARLGGATQEEGIALREALASGDAAAAQALIDGMRERGVEFTLPEQPASYWTEPDEGYSVDAGLVTGLPRRIWDTGAGIVEGTLRAGQFIIDSAGNVVATVSESGQIIAAEATVAGAEQQRINQAQQLLDSLHRQGIDPERALEIAQAFAAGNTAPLTDLRQQRESAESKSDFSVADLDALDDEFMSAGDDASDMDVMILEGADEYAEGFSSAAASSQEVQDARDVLTSAPSSVQVMDMDQVLREERERAEAAELARQSGSSQDSAANAALWAATMDGLDATSLEQDHLAQQSLEASRRDGQAQLQIAANRPDPRMSAGEFSAQVSDLQRQADLLDAEQTRILMNPGGGSTTTVTDPNAAGLIPTAGTDLCRYDFSPSDFICKCPGHSFEPSKGGCVADPNATAPLDPSKGGQYGGAAIAAAVAGNESGFDVRQAKCDDVVKAGGNNPASISIDSGGFGGSAKLTFDHYGVKDRLAVISGGAVVFDSGCMNLEGDAQLSLTNYGQIKVIVEPNCAQTTNSQWEFRVACPASVAAQ